MNNLADPELLTVYYVLTKEAAIPNQSDSSECIGRWFKSWLKIGRRGRLIDYCYPYALQSDGTWLQCGRVVKDFRLIDLYTHDVFLKYKDTPMILTMDHLLNRVSKIWLTPTKTININTEALYKYALPDWWVPEIDNTPACVLEVSGGMAKICKFDLLSILNLAHLPRFKTSENIKTYRDLILKGWQLELTPKGWLWSPSLPLIEEWDYWLNVYVKPTE